jgi:hypothetical protein
LSHQDLSQLICKNNPYLASIGAFYDSANIPHRYPLCFLIDSGSHRRL